MKSRMAVRELCSVVAWMGRGLGREWIHRYVWMNPFAVHLKLSQHWLLIGYVLCCAVLSCLVVSDFATPWTVACQAPLSMGIPQARILRWVAMPSSRGSSQPRDWTQVSWSRLIPYHLSHQGRLKSELLICLWLFDFRYLGEKGMCWWREGSIKSHMFK